MNINIEDFISFLTIKKNLSSQSVRHCRIRFKVIDKWLNGRQLSKELVELFFYERKQAGQGNNSLNTYYFVFNQLQAYMKDRGLSGNFMEGFKSFKKTKSKINIFSQEEIEKLLNVKISYGSFHGKDCNFLDEMYSVFTMFLAYTGCRFSEVRNLIVQDLDLSNGQVEIRGAKTYEFRKVYITEPLIGRLKNLITGMGEKQYVFVNAAGNPLNPQDYDRDLKSRAKKAEITKRTFPHNFRHTYITNLLESGVPITEVATLVGHKDIQTTYSTYMHLADQTLKKAALRHPLIRKNVEPKYMLQIVKETVQNLNLSGDNRFDFSLLETDNKIEFIFKLK